MFGQILVWNAVQLIHVNVSQIFRNETTNEIWCTKIAQYHEQHK